MQCGKLAWPMLSRSLHSYSHLLDCEYKVTNNFETMQVFESTESCSFKLFLIISNYTKLFAHFFGHFRYFLYLCTIKHVSLNPNHHAKTECSIHGSRRTRTALFPLHPATVRLAETEVPAPRRTGSATPCDTPPTHVSSSRSKHYLPTPRAALSCPFSDLFRLSDFGLRKLRLSLKDITT